MRRQASPRRLGVFIAHRIADSSTPEVDGQVAAWVDGGVTPGSERSSRILIADDEVLVRKGLVSVLRESGYDVVGEMSDATNLVDLVRELRPEVAIVDIRMPPTYTTEGLDAARAIRASLPDVAVLVLSAHIEVEYALDLLGMGGGVGYLLKTRLADAAELTDTLERLRSGGTVIDPALVEELVRARRARDPLDVLSLREREVLALMAEGRSNVGIGRLLEVTPDTVGKHVKSIFKKLQLPTAPDDHRRVLAAIAFLGSQ
jgi:DNA-binding NarL/FixJ family response regulator